MLKKLLIRIKDKVESNVATNRLRIISKRFHIAVMSLGVIIKPHLSYNVDERIYMKYFSERKYIVRSCITLFLVDVIIIYYLKYGSNAYYLLCSNDEPALK